MDDLGLTKNLKNTPLYIRSGQPVVISDSCAPILKKARIDKDAHIIADKTNNALKTPEESVMKKNNPVNNNIVSAAPVTNVPNNVLTLILISDRDLKATALGQKIIYDSKQKVIETICIDDNSEKNAHSNMPKTSEQNISKENDPVEYRENNLKLPELNDNCVPPLTVNVGDSETLAVNDEHLQTCEVNEKDLKTVDDNEKNLKPVEADSKNFKTLDTNLIFRIPKEVSKQVNLLTYKFNSSIFQRVKEKKDCTMLPSMPFLATPLKHVVAKDLDLTDVSQNPEEDKTISENRITNKQDELEETPVDAEKASTSNKKVILGFKFLLVNLNNVTSFEVRH